MPGDIDEQAYQEGIAAFGNGGTLRSLFERIAQDVADDPRAEDRGMSFALGFADAALSTLRNAAYGGR